MSEYDLDMLITEENIKVQKYYEKLEQENAKLKEQLEDDKKLHGGIFNAYEKINNDLRKQLADRDAKLKLAREGLERIKRKSSRTITPQTQAYLIATDTLTALEDEQPEYKYDPTAPTVLEIAEKIIKDIPDEDFQEQADGVWLSGEGREVIEKALMYGWGKPQALAILRKEKE